MKQEELDHTHTAAITNLVATLFILSVTLYGCTFYVTHSRCGTIDFIVYNKYIFLVHRVE